MDHVVVLDIGSQFLKAGTPYNFPNDPDPRVVSALSHALPEGL
jgi:hypothetical protein